MRAQVELVQHMAALGVDENDVIGKIVGDKQLFGRPVAGDHREAGRIGDNGSVGGLPGALGYFLSRCGNLRRNLYEAIPGEPALMKTVNCNPISCVLRLLAGGVSDRTDRSIKMFTVGSKGKPRK